MRVTFRPKPMDSLATAVTEHPFMQNLSPASVQFFVRNASQTGYDAQQLIFKEGEDADRFFLIQEGKVALGSLARGRGNILTKTIGAGEALGWSWMFPPYRWHFDARALEPVKAIVVDAKLIREKCHADHDFGFELVLRMGEIIAARLQATRRQVLSQYGMR